MKLYAYTHTQSYPTEKLFQGIVLIGQTDVGGARARPTLTLSEWRTRQFLSDSRSFLLLVTVIQTPVDVVHKRLHKVAAVDDLVQSILQAETEVMISHEHLYIWVEFSKAVYH